MATLSRLNPVQVHLLRFFNEKNISEQETTEIQQLIAHHYAQKADLLMEKIWVEKQLDSSKMEELLNKDLTKK